MQAIFAIPSRLANLRPGGHPNPRHLVSPTGSTPRRLSSARRAIVRKDRRPFKTWLPSTCPGVADHRRCDRLVELPPRHRAETPLLGLPVSLPGRRSSAPTLLRVSRPHLHSATRRCCKRFSEGAWRTRRRCAWKADDASDFGYHAATSAHPTRPGRGFHRDPPGSFD